MIFNYFLNKYEYNLFIQSIIPKKKEKELRCKDMY